MKKLLYILPLLFILAGCKNNFSQIENFPNQNDADVYTVSGSVCALACPPSSALPSSLINEAMNNSRAAVPSNGAILSYTIKATNIKDKNGNEIESESEYQKVVYGTVSSGKFTLKLTALGTWRIELTGTDSYSDYKGATDITLTNELSNITDIVVYAFYTGENSLGSGKGYIRLPISIDENTGITEWSYILIDSSGHWVSYTDGGILTPISYSNGKYFINIYRDDKTAGVYDLKFTFKKQNDVVYECTEKITVFSEITTDTWLISSSTDGIVSENEAKHLHKLPNGEIEFRITSDIISEPNKNFSTQYYVNPSDTTVTFGEGSNAETFPAGNDDTGLGTKAAPYKTISTALNVINAVNDGISEYSIILLADSTAPDDLPSTAKAYITLDNSIIKKDLNLKLTSYKTIAGVQNNFKIDAASENRVIYVGDTSKNVRLTLENITITGGEKTDDNGAGIYIDGTSAENANELILNNGAKITSNTVNNDKSGGGIYAKKAKITINDGAKISINTASLNAKGGGLYCEGCDVIMNGGVITRNMANNGAGIYLTYLDSNKSTFIMNGGEISSNSGLTTDTDSVLKGAGICTEGSSSVKNNVIINNGKIKENNFPFSYILNSNNLEGAGIYSSFSDITINNCEISGNYITNNKSSSYIKGAGLSINNSTVTINNAQFINNKLDNGPNTYDGGAIYVDSASSLSINGGYFSGNVAKNGSGIYSSANINFSGSPYFSDDDDIYLVSGKTVVVDKSVFPPVGKEYVANFSPACTGQVLSAVNSNTTVLAEKTPYFSAKDFLDSAGTIPINVLQVPSGVIPKKVTSGDDIPTDGSSYYIVLSEGADFSDTIMMNSDGLVMVVGEHDITDATYSFYDFTGCQNLIKVDLSLSTKLTTIPPYNFDLCTKLTSVSLPSSITEIGNNAFMTCEKLTSIVLPSSLNKIGQHVFYACNSLKTIQFNAYSDKWFSTSTNEYTGGDPCEKLNNPMLDEEMIQELFCSDKYYYKQG